MSSWQERAKQLGHETYALYLAHKDPRTPWYARLVGAMVVAYALSPLDLIPDFIPVLGYLDDALLVPLGILLALKLVPAEVMEESRQRSRHDLAAGLPANRKAALVIVLIWVICLALVGLLFYRFWRR